MELKDTNFDILEILNKENNNDDLNILLNTNEIIEIDTKSTLSNIDNTYIEEIKKDDFIQDTNNISLLRKIINSILFLFKYLLTSSFIFILLLCITNYSAYIEIAKSYLNPLILEQNKQNLLSSINGININLEDNSNSKKNSQFMNKDIIDKDTIGEKMNMVKNKTYHSMYKLINDNYDDKLNMQIEIVPYENRIVIPKIGKNIPLIEVKNKTVQNVKELEDIFMTELANGIVRYPGSARPGENGNSFIFGHSSNFPWIKGNYNDAFTLLDNVVFGDEIIAYYNQKKYIYKVKEKKVIKPGDVSILKRNIKKSEITLMTCWPIGTTINRMIVIGELVK